MGRFMLLQLELASTNLIRSTTTVIFSSDALIFVDFFYVDFSSHVAWSVSCPGGRIEEGKPPDPFVLPYSLPSLLPPG
jgi:hypothetical protein